MYSRKDYMDCTVTHREYYGQLVNDSVKSLVVSRIGRERILAAKHLNDIPLHLWDSLAAPIIASVPSFPEGETWTLSTVVCIAKEAARQIQDENHA